MTIETSTMNVLMLGILSLQCWMVRQVFKLERKVSVIISHCNKCPNKGELDTDQITRK
jgi:low affinity Fe/Cu permease